jgi:hypothetical protein
VADIFNSAIAKNTDFTGIPMGNTPNKVFGYADDTAVLVSTAADILILERTMGDYEEATGGLVNPEKTDTILLGKWKNPNLRPEIPTPITEFSTYLGVPTGPKSQAKEEEIQKGWDKREQKIVNILEYWHKRCSASPVERTGVAKVMALSLLWYHASVMPIPEKTFEKIDAHVIKFIWQGKQSKIAKSTMIGDKDEGGVKLWSTIAKAGF